MNDPLALRGRHIAASEPKITSNCWPDPEQQFLLAAALLPDMDKAWANWRQFEQRVDIQILPHSTTNLTPLAYRRLRGFSSLALQTAKSIYRHTWAKNQRDMHVLGELIDQLKHAGISVTLLKGAAMIDTYYRDPGLRVIGDFDLLVDKDQVLDAIKTLAKSDFSPTTPFTENTLIRRHAQSLINPQGVHIDLHWHVFGDSPRDQWLMGFNFETRPAQTLSAQVLCPEDQVLHTLVHGLRYSPVSLLRWIPDATIVLNSTSPVSAFNNANQPKQPTHPKHPGNTASSVHAFRWDYFFNQTRDLRLEYVVSQALGYLHSAKFINLAEPSSTELQNLIATPADRQWFEFLMGERKGLFYPYRYIWHAYGRNQPQDDPSASRTAQASDKLRFFRTTLNTAQGLPGYIKRTFGLQSNAELLRFVVSETLRRLFKTQDIS